MLLDSSRVLCLLQVQQCLAKLQDHTMTNTALRAGHSYELHNLGKLAQNPACFHVCAICCPSGTAIAHCSVQCVCRRFAGLPSFQCSRSC